MNFFLRFFPECKQKNLGLADRFRKLFHYHPTLPFYNKGITNNLKVKMVLSPHNLYSSYYFMKIKYNEMK